MGFIGVGCCCGAACDMEDCDISVTEWTGSSIDTDEIICSDGTPASVTISNDQDVAEGQPTPSRKFSISQSGTAVGGTYAYAFIFDQTMPLSPIDAGEVISASWCVESKKQSSTIQVTVIPAVRQGSNLYVRSSGNDIGSSWRSNNWSGSVASFSKLESGSLDPNTSLHPSTSPSADPIELGFAIRFFIDDGDTNINATAYTDNLCINYTGDFLCQCTRAMEFQVDVSGIGDIPTAWPEADGSYVVSYIDSTIPQFCRWGLTIPATGVDWTIQLLINKTDGSAAQVAFGRGNEHARFRSAIGETISCTDQITLYNTSTGLHGGDFPATITVTPV